MIEFVTILLGLMIGPQSIELSAEPRVAKIHLMLDGRTVEVLDIGPPWRATLQLGDTLRPRRLEAVAFDRKGNETGRAQQILNYTRAGHEIGITLGGGDRRQGRLVWRAILGQAPARVDVRFDGEPLAVENTGAFVLPAYDLGVPHVLEAAAVFPDGVEARAELAVGGGLGEEVTSALSPVVLRSRPGRPWPADKVEGWIEHDGRAVGVFGTRATPRRLVVVRDTAANRGIGYFGGQLERMKQDIPWRGGMEDTYLSLVSPVPLGDHAGTFEIDDVPVTLTRRQELRRVLTTPFTIHPADNEPDARDRQELWSALTIAGKRAVSSRGARAVLLMIENGLDRGPSGRAQPSLAMARDFLASVRVPVFVWASNKDALEALGLQGEDRTYYGLRGLAKAMEEADRELDRQTVVLVEGDFLPHEVRLADDVPKRVEWVR